MTTERSDKVFEYWRQASDKFDYFVTGATMALCAYISQTMTIEKVAISPGTLELVSLLVLVTSVIVGLKRIQWGVEVHRHNHSKLYNSEVIGELTHQRMSGTVLNRSTGEMSSPSMIEARVIALKMLASQHEEAMMTAGKKSTRWYKIRNRLLLLGFLILVASKVWAAYV